MWSFLFNRCNTRGHCENSFCDEPRLLSDEGSEQDTTQICFSSDYIGITFGSGFEGNIVQKVIPGSQAFIKNVGIGWEVLSINGKEQPNDSIAINKTIKSLRLSKKSINIIFLKEIDEVTANLEKKQCELNREMKLAVNVKDWIVAGKLQSELNEVKLLLAKKRNLKAKNCFQYNDEYSKDELVNMLFGLINHTSPEILIMIVDYCKKEKK